MGNWPRLFEGLIDMAPLVQIQEFLAWFYHQAVGLFDIHLKVPKASGEDYKTGNWIWLTHHEGISAWDINQRLMGFIRQKNANGADIYFRPHKNQKHKVIFLDDIPIHKARVILKKYGVCIIETHPGNTQVWLSVNRPLEKEERKQAQMYLRDLGYTDPGSISGDHLGRLCGVKSQKRNCWVNFVGSSDLKPWIPQICQDLSLPPCMLKIMQFYMFLSFSVEK